VRYRAVNDLSDISRDAAIVADFIGQDQYRESFASIGRSLNAKGFVTPYDDEAFALELELLNLELLRARGGERFYTLPEACHAGVDFLIGVGQTIPCLSAGAKTRLLGRLRKGLKEGLWPLQHEFRVAGLLSKLGWDVYFHDLEEDGGYDFLATRDGIACEVEAKAISLYTAWPIKPENIGKLFVELKQCFSWDDEKTIPILGLKFTANLLPERTQLRELVSALNDVAQTGEEIFLPGVKVRRIGTVPNMPIEKLMKAAQVHSQMVRKTVIGNALSPRIVLEFDSNKPVQLAKKMIRTLREAAKEQFSLSRPGAIWMHIGMITNDLFKTFGSTYYGRAGLLDRIAESVLLSEKRNNLSQLMFSGGSFLKKTSTVAHSAFESVTYESPRCRFGPTAIFPVGRRWPGSKEKLSNVQQASVNTKPIED